MKEFVVIYRANEDAMQEIQKSSDEQHKEGMQKWFAWAEKCGDSLVTLGSPLGQCLRVSDSGSSDEKSDIVGYSVLQAENMDGAKKLLDGHPNLGWNSGCSIELHETMPMPK